MSSTSIFCSVSTVSLPLPARTSPRSWGKLNYQCIRVRCGQCDSAAMETMNTYRHINYDHSENYSMRSLARIRILSPQKHPIIQNPQPPTPKHHSRFLKSASTIIPLPNSRRHTSIPKKKKYPSPLRYTDPSHKDSSLVHHFAPTHKDSSPSHTHPTPSAANNSSDPH